MQGAPKARQQVAPGVSLGSRRDNRSSPRRGRQKKTGGPGSRYGGLNEADLLSTSPFLKPLSASLQIVVRFAFFRLHRFEFNWLRTSVVFLFLVRGAGFRGSVFALAASCLFIWSIFFWHALIIATETLAPNFAVVLFLFPVTQTVSLRGLLTVSTWVDEIRTGRSSVQSRISIHVRRRRVFRSTLTSPSHQR